MGRPLRTDAPGAWHHVMNRGGRHDAIFRDDVDRHGFLALLGELRAREEIEVHAFCLMSDHYHGVMRCPDGGLSRGMQYLSTVYTKRFNARHGHDGPLFRGRFRSRLIDDDAYLLTAVRYVHRNPTDLGADIARYRWSSHAAYLGWSPGPRWLETDVVAQLCGNRVDRYRHLVEGAPTEELPEIDLAPFGRSRARTDGV